MRRLATRELPMKARAAISPDSTMGPATSRPSPLMMLTTPGGKASAKHSSRGAWQSSPNRGSLATTGLPMTNAGMRVVKVSFKG